MYYNSHGGYNYQGNGDLDYVDNYYANWFSIAGGWKYTYETNYTRPSSSGSYHGRIQMKVILMNEGWSGHLNWDLLIFTSQVVIILGLMNMDMVEQDIILM